MQPFKILYFAIVSCLIMIAASVAISQVRGMQSLTGKSELQTKKSDRCEVIISKSSDDEITSINILAPVRIWDRTKENSYNILDRNKVFQLSSKKVFSQFNFKKKMDYMNEGFVLEGIRESNNELDKVFFHFDLNQGKIAAVQMSYVSKIKGKTKVSLEQSCSQLK